MIARTAFLVTLLASATAHADLVKLYAEVHGGGTLGTGLSGDQQDAAFFQRAAPGTYGFLVGARLLVANASISHHQYLRVGGGEVGESDLSTWTQFDVGLAFAIDVSEKPANAPKDARSGAFLEVGVNAGFGVGTGEQVMPPLSNDEVTDKGFLLEGRLAFGTHLNKFLDAGVVVPVAWGYYFKSGVDDAANDVSTHYQGLHGSALVFVRANVNLL